MTVHFAPPPPAAVSRLLARFDRAELAAFIAVAIDLLDLADGDADEEDDERSGILMIADGVDYDGAEDSDEPDGLPGVPEDAEDDEDACCAHDDDPAFRAFDRYPGDPDDAELEEDHGVDDLGEGEQMHDDVPMVPAFSLEIDHETGRRRHLGHVNLMTSFVGGDLMVSADTGRSFRLRRGREEMGRPV